MTRTIRIEDEANLLALAEIEAGIAAQAIGARQPDVLSVCVLNVLQGAAERKLHPDLVQSVIFHFCNKLIEFWRPDQTDGRAGASLR